MVSGRKSIFWLHHDALRQIDIFVTQTAPRKFLNHLDIDRAVSGHTIRSILMHKFTYRNEDVDSDDEDSDNVVASVEPNDEIRDEDNYQRHIPLEVPEAPPGLAEFSLARYLYVSKCQVGIYRNARSACAVRILTY